MSSTYETGKWRRGTTFTVSFPTLPTLKEQPLRIEITQKPFSHDYGVLEFPRSSDLWMKHMKTGVPVLVTWKQGTLSREWAGYVSYAKKTVVAQRQQGMEVHCFGSTFPLKTKLCQVFKNSTIPEAVAKLAKQYGFKYYGEPNSRRFDQLTMSGQVSVLEWMREQGRSIGYVVVVENTNLYFKPIDKFINQKMKNVPVFDHNGSDLPISNQYLDRTLDSFEVLSGDYIEGMGPNNTSKTVSGIDPLTGKTFSFTTQPNKVGTNLRQTSSAVFFAEQMTNMVVNSPTAAQAAAVGAANMARFNLPATCKGQGDPRVSPFSPVYLTGIGEAFEGYWLVKEVKHTIHSIGDYSLVMKVATDGVGNTVANAFRRAEATLVGAVDLVGATVGSIVNPTNLNAAGTKLSIKKPIVVSNQQGYAKTGIAWKPNARKGGVKK